MNYEQLLRAVFSCFYEPKLKFKKIFLHCRVRTKRLLDTKVIFFLKLGSILGGLKIVFLGLAVLVL